MEPIPCYVRLEAGKNCDRAAILLEHIAVEHRVHAVVVLKTGPRKPRVLALEDVEVEIPIMMFPPTKVGSPDDRHFSPQPALAPGSPLPFGEHDGRQERPSGEPPDEPKVRVFA